MPLVYLLAYVFLWTLARERWRERSTRVGLRPISSTGDRSNKHQKLSLLFCMQQQIAKRHGRKVSCGSWQEHQISFPSFQYLYLFGVNPIDRSLGQMMPYEETGSKGSNNPLKPNTINNRSSTQNRSVHSEEAVKNSSRGNTGESQDGVDERV